MKDGEETPKSSRAQDQECAMQQAFFGQRAIASAIFDSGGICLLANEAFQHQMAYRAEKLGALRWENLFEQSCEAEIARNELLEKRLVVQRDVMLRDGRGNRRRMPLLGEAFRFQNQDCFHICLLDMGSMDKLERKMPIERDGLAGVMDAIPLGLFLVDAQDRIMEVNPAFCDMLALQAEQLRGASSQELISHLLSGASDADIARQTLLQAIASVAESPVVEITRGGERMRNLEISFFAIWGDDGSQHAWGGVLRDATAGRARTAWKLGMLSALAREIRAPLATLKGHTTALLGNYRSWSPAVVGEFLQAMDETTDELVENVDRSLALTRVEAGRLGIRPEASSPRRLVDQALERAARVLGEAEVIVDLPDQLPEVRVDPARAEEALVHILDFAARRTAENMEIKIEARINGPRLEISISDSGPVLAHEQQRSLFEKPAPEQAGERGSLGLYIAHRIVEAHGGGMWVESPCPGELQGARLSLTLPLMPSRPAEQLTPAWESQAAEQMKHGGRVLIVGGAAESQPLLRSMLLHAGYEVQWAPTGPGALDTLKTWSPHLVLLDCTANEEKGLAVGRAIRQWSDTPALVITSRTSQEDLLSLMAEEADDYVVTPFQTSDLMARMEALLRRAETTALRADMTALGGPGLVIDTAGREVWRDGEKVELTPTEFNLLEFLARNRGQVLTYTRLVEHLWGLEKGKSKHDLFVHMSRLRKKLEGRPGRGPYIVTRWGIGYVFMPGAR
jgi:two-component system KDP operon response regulator KdpE